MSSPDGLISDNWPRLVNPGSYMCETDISFGVGVLLIFVWFNSMDWGFFRKIQKMFFSPEDGWIEKLMELSESATRELSNEWSCQ
jgi:hypothetical protein